MRLIAILALLISAPALAGTGKGASYVFVPSSITPDDAVTAEAKLIDHKVRQGDRFFLMARDFGGVKPLSDFLRKAPAEDIQRRLDGYGMKYVDLSREHAVSRPDAASETSSALASPSPSATAADSTLFDCVRYLDQRWRNMIIKVDASQTITIDGQGRPGYAEWKGGPGIPVQQYGRTSCQTTVGSWGEATDDGGHLVGVQLGGAPWRFNLTPQNSTLNRGAWRDWVENLAVYCRQYNTTLLMVTPEYLTDASVRPQAYLVNIVFQAVDSAGELGEWPTDESGNRPPPDRVPNRPLTDFEKTTFKRLYEFLHAGCPLKIN